MNEQVWWYLARSSGIAALVLMVGSLLWGVLLSTRMLREIDRPAWLLDLHRWLGSLAVITTGLHLLGLVLDSYISFGWTDILIPGASSYEPFGVALGVLSMYGLAAVQGTSVAKRHLPNRVWRSTHFVSYGALWAAAMHAGLSGTDVSNRIYQAVALVLTIAVIGAVLFRVLLPGGRRKGRPKRRPAAEAPAAPTAPAAPPAEAPTSR